ncbi:acyltransferase [Lithospermum erythrorhizon]|uniref:diacylglycerol O-acyltransferase n=1 Tax=Lithospermum erythrorhizon TaxID=34254 RepID=A0AAV3QGS6_LITER
MQGNIIEPQVATVKMTEEKGNLNDGMMSLKPITTKMEKKYGVCAEETEDALLSPSSRMFHEPNYNVHILGIIGWRAPEVLNWDLIKENLADTMLKQPRFSSLQVADKKDGRKIRWVPTEVDLDNHIIIPNLELSNYSSADELVDDYITTLSKTPMDMSKPLWEIHVLQLKSPSNSYSVFRFHHSLGDGVSLVQILLSCTRKTSDPDSPPDLPIPNIRKMNRQGKSEGYLWNSLMKMWFILRLFVNTMIDITLFFATALMLLRDSETPIRSSKVDNDSAHRRFIHCSVSLDDVKVVKSATNSTVNDVVLGVVQAGLSRYFTRRYGER